MARRIMIAFGVVGLLSGCSPPVESEGPANEAPPSATDTFVAPVDTGEAVEVAAPLPDPGPAPEDAPPAEDEPAPPPVDTGPPPEEDTATPADTGPPACPEGVICVESLPYTDLSDTSGQASLFDVYPCKASADESGPEVVYQVTVDAPGFLAAAVYDEGDVDIDVHILSELAPQACLARGHRHAAVDVDAGTYWIVADTFVSGGEALAGPFKLDIGLYTPSAGLCGMETGIMKRVGDGGDHLAMPATGPMVLEAHLVTQDEPKPYPSTSTDELAEHYALSQSTTGFVLHRQQKWAPLEGGDFYGAGIGSPTLFPTLHEGWYVNMYWTKESRPDRGTRMILREPGTNRAVVVAAGYETGPGNLAHIGGTPEESHFYLGTTHLDELTLGIATDQDLPFGPRVCTD